MYILVFVAYLTNNLVIDYVLYAKTSICNQLAKYSSFILEFEQKNNENSYL